MASSGRAFVDLIGHIPLLEALVDAHNTSYRDGLPLDSSSHPGAVFPNYSTGVIAANEQLKGVNALDIRPSAVPRHADETLFFEIEKYVNSKRDGIAIISEDDVNTLVRRLLTKTDAWTEGDKSADATAAFIDNIRCETDALKVKGLGPQISHFVGTIYMEQARSFLDSRPGIVHGFLAKVKLSGSLLLEGLRVVSNAASAYVDSESLFKKGGEVKERCDSSPTYQETIQKMASAAWQCSLFEMRMVLLQVCYRVYDESATPSKRAERARAMFMIGQIYTDMRNGVGENPALLEPTPQRL